MTTTNVRERPILFSAAMVRAILAGTKTQTRRIVKPQPERYETKNGWGLTWKDNKCGGGSDWLVKYCPYGTVGDRLWVRETWAHDPSPGANCDDHLCGLPTHVWYRASVSDEHASMHAGAARWRPSIHMPRWASRIELEIAAVRVERLRDISEGDADAEGFGGYFPARAFPNHAWSQAALDGDKSIPECFAELWDAINGKRAPWSSNPWVWVIDFRRTKP